MNDFKKFMELYPQNEKKVDSNAEYFKLLKKIRNDLKNIIDKKYFVNSACGQGNLADVPWLCIFEPSITRKAEYGIYIAILFKSDMSGFYVTLNQGMQTFRDKYGIKKGDEYLSKVSEHFREKISSDRFNLSSIDLNVSKGSRGNGYEKGTVIAKYYKKEDINELELYDDIIDIVNLYEDICKDLECSSYDEVINNVIEDLDNNYINISGAFDEIKQKELNERETNIINEDLVEIEIPSLERGKSSSLRTDMVRKIDGVKKATKDVKTGLIGEKLVFDYEMKKMIRHNRADLCDKIKRVSEDNDNAGYDILSYDFDENGNEYPIYIEVKTTELSEKNQFFLTQNEREKMKNNAKAYFIYRVSIKNGVPKFYKINYKDLMSKFKIENYSYVVNLKSGEMDE